MSLQANDLFVVQRGNTLYNLKSSTLRQNLSATAQVFVGENPPSSDAVQGDLWWSTREGNLFIYYNDGDSQQWVDASPAFVEADYIRIENYIDQSVSENAVAQIVAEDEITVSPSDGKGIVRIGVNLSGVNQDISDLDSKFETDQQRQDDEIERLENIIKDLADRLDQLEDTVAGLATIDGGYPNAEGVFDEDDTDGGSADPTSMTGTPISGGNAEGYD